MTAKNGKNKSCETCGKEFYVPLGKLNRSRFCSHGCAGKFHVVRLNATRKKPIQHPAWFKSGDTQGSKNHNWVSPVIVICNWCNASLERKPNELIDRTTHQRKAHFYCNRSCFAQWKSHNWSGENSASWRGGSTPYYGVDWQRQRRRARARDSHTCQKCGVTEKQIGKALEVHHLKRFGDFADSKEANRISNLVCLCRDCHMIVEYHEKEWLPHGAKPVSIG